jgi:hypothetical protein
MNVPVDKEDKYLLQGHPHDSAPIPDKSSNFHPKLALNMRQECLWTGDSSDIFIWLFPPRSCVASWKKGNSELKAERTTQRIAAAIAQLIEICY